MEEQSHPTEGEQEADVDEMLTAAQTMTEDEILARIKEIRAEAAALIARTREEEESGAEMREVVELLQKELQQTDQKYELKRRERVQAEKQLFEVSRQVREDEEARTRRRSRSKSKSEEPVKNKRKRAPTRSARSEMDGRGRTKSSFTLPFGLNAEGEDSMSMDLITPPPSVV